MADLKKVMQKLNSQKSETAKAPVKKKVKKVEEVEEVEEDFEEDKDLDDDQEEDSEETEDDDAEEDPEVEKETTIDEETAILQQIERLQNDGFYRYEDLTVKHQLLQELKVLNYQILKALRGEDGKKTK